MKKPTISMIVAMDENRGIGYQGKIPWHIKEDLLRFKHLTLGKTVIMGRKTFESVLGYYQKSGRPIPERNHIIITRDRNYQSPLENSFVVDSIEKAIRLAKRIEEKEVFISGGAQTFAQGIKYADKLYLTIVDGEFKTDTVFTEYKHIFKKKIFEEKKEAEDYRFRFVELMK